MEKEKISNSKIFDVIKKSLSVFFIEKYWYFFNEDEAKTICNNKTLINLLSDNFISNNHFFFERINWSLFDNKKFIRLVCRSIDLGTFETSKETITQSRKNVKPIDIVPIIKREPNLYKDFGIDLAKLDKKEAIEFLKTGYEIFIELIDLKKYAFNNFESFDICKAFGFKRKIILLFDYKKFNSTQVSEVLKRTGQENIDLLNYSIITPQDWIYILTDRKELFGFINLEIFQKTDVFNTIKLLSLFDDENIHNMFLNRNKQEITDYGWELLNHFHKIRYAEIIPEYIKEKKINQ